MAKARNRRPAEAAAMDRIFKVASITPDQLHTAQLMPLSRNLIYAACNSGEIECFRVGKKIIIPTAPLRRKLGVVEAA
jgi:hypothetical protein